ARIYTMAEGPRAPARAEALAIAGSRILAVGESGAMRGLLRTGGRTVNLGGRAVIPGLIDAHVHFGWYSLAVHQNRVDLDNVPSKEEALARVAAAAARTPAGGWVQGAGWNKNIWAGGQFPTATDLDGVAPAHPVALADKSHHALWVNSRALEAAGITAGTPDPKGGEIVRDDRGRPTGMLLETAEELVSQAIPEPGVAEMMAALRQGIARAQALGLTGVHDPGHPTVLAAMQALHAAGELGLRALVMIPGDDLDAALRLGLRSGLGDEALRLGGIKIFADGALGPQTAHMLAPYEGLAGDGPGGGPEGRPRGLGIPTHTAAELATMVRRANAAGLAVAIHAIGDAANRAALDAIEEAQAGAGAGSSPPLLGVPNRIEHVQLLHGDDVARLAALGVVASMQPIHATSDMEMAGRYWGERCALAYAWRSVLGAGGALAFGSDCPIETLDPLAGIHAAVTRRRADGSPGPEGWIPGQRLSVAEAVQAYTLGAARASGEERLKGSLVPGKLADLAVLSRDIFEIEPMEILEARVETSGHDTGPVPGWL
ncbi:MAG: amidohydrolase, partial [Anaerolineae bacterium]